MKGIVHMGVSYLVTLIYHLLALSTGHCKQDRKSAMLPSYGFLPRADNR